MAADEHDGDVRVTLDVRRGAEPIQGSAEGPAGVARRFLGWLELVSIIEQFRALLPPSDLADESYSKNTTGGDAPQRRPIGPAARDAGACPGD
jgi:hypothetical protein